VIRDILLAALYFALWIGTLILIKSLILEEYHIEFHHYSMALVGALILSKVVLILEHVSLGAWVRSRPAWVGVILRTLLCAVGVLIVLVLEKGIEGRHEHGGFDGAVEAALQGADAPPRLGQRDLHHRRAARLERRQRGRATPRQARIREAVPRPAAAQGPLTPPREGRAPARYARLSTRRSCSFSPAHHSFSVGGSSTREFEDDGRARERGRSPGTAAFPPSVPFVPSASRARSQTTPPRPPRDALTANQRDALMPP